MDNYMKLALKEAIKAAKCGEIPIGAVIVKNNKVIAKAHNTKEKSSDSTNHAEILVIKKACKKLKNWRLLDCELYVTMEPCMMCSGAIKESRISKLIYGIKNENFGYSNNINDIEITGGICENECKMLVQKFFKKKRNNL